MGALVIWLGPWITTAGPLIGYYLVAVSLIPFVDPPHSQSKRSNYGLRVIAFPIIHDECSREHADPTNSLSERLMSCSLPLPRQTPVERPKKPSPLVQSS